LDRDFRLVLRTDKNKLGLSFADATLSLLPLATPLITGDQG
jgi:hypothetical protein